MQLRRRVEDACLQVLLVRERTERDLLDGTRRKRRTGEKFSAWRRGEERERRVRASRLADGKRTIMRDIAVHPCIGGKRGHRRYLLRSGWKSSSSNVSRHAVSCSNMQMVQELGCWSGVGSSCAKSRRGGKVERGKGASTCCRSSPTGGEHGASRRTRRRRWRGSRCPRTPGRGRGPGCSGRTPGCRGWQPSFRRGRYASAQ